MGLMEDYNPSFEILHFSYRHWKSYHEEGCYNVNLVFRASDTDDEYYSSKQRFMHETEEWHKSEIVQDLELEQKYIHGLAAKIKKTGKDLFDGWREEKESEDFDPNELVEIDIVNEEGIDREDVYIKGYQRNESMMLQYIEKFNVFRFYEFFEINPATKGIIGYIEELRKLNNPDQYHSGQFLRAIKSLENWWD
jgi:hypothetical protein